MEGYILEKKVRDQEDIRISFNNLFKTTFDMTFENWYRRGYWDDSYIPYCLVDRGEVVANVSVNIMDIEYFQEEKRLIQLGTVMTREDYRGQGLASFLMEEVLRDYGEADLTYLFSNAGAVDFYPRFNFTEEEEYISYLRTRGGRPSYRRLDINKEEDLDLLESRFSLGNPFSPLNFKNNLGILMFGLLEFMGEHIYYLEDLDLVAIGEACGRDYIVYDIYGRTEKSLDQVLDQLVARETERIFLGFSPYKDLGLALEKYREEDSRLFIKNDRSGIFKDRLIIPLLFHA